MADLNFFLRLFVKDEGATSRLNKLQASIKGLQGTVNTAGGTFRSAGGFLQSLISPTTLLAGATMYLGKQSLFAAGQMEQWSISFSTMLGSAEAGKKMLKDLADFAKRTPFELSQLTDLAVRLKAMGIETENVIPTLETLGNVAAGVGMEKMPQLILAFGQIKAAGRLMGTELRQLSEAGVDLAQAMGISSGKLRELVSQGKVSFQDVEKALYNLTHGTGRLSGLMEKQMVTLFAKISNLKDGLFQLFAKLGEDLMPIIKPIVDGMISFVNTLLQVPALRAAIIPAIGAIAIALGGLGMAFNIALGGVPMIIAGIITAIVGLSSVVGQFFRKLEDKNNEELQRQVQKNNEKIKKLRKTQTTVKKVVESVNIDNVKKTVGGAVENVKEAITPENINKTVGNVKKGIGSLWGSVKQGVKGIIKTTTDTVKSAPSNILSATKKTVTGQSEADKLEQENKKIQKIMDDRKKKDKEIKIDTKKDDNKTKYSFDSSLGGTTKDQLKQQKKQEADAKKSAAKAKKDQEKAEKDAAKQALKDEQDAYKNRLHEFRLYVKNKQKLDNLSKAETLQLEVDGIKDILANQKMSASQRMQLEKELADKQLSLKKEQDRLEKESVANKIKDAQQANAMKMKYDEMSAMDALKMEIETTKDILMNQKLTNEQRLQLEQELVNKKKKLKELEATEEQKEIDKKLKEAREFNAKKAKIEELNKSDTIKLEIDTLKDVLLNQKIGNDQRLQLEKELADKKKQLKQAELAEQNITLQKWLSNETNVLSVLKTAWEGYYSQELSLLQNWANATVNIFKQVLLQYLEGKKQQVIAEKVAGIVSAVSSKNYAQAALLAAQGGAAVTAIEAAKAVVGATTLKLATGGIVAGEQIATIGEQNRKEAVLPLETRQGRKALANAMADANSINGSGAVQNVTLMIDKYKLGEVMVGANNNASRHGRY